MATTVNSGVNFEIRNITLNSTTDTPVDFNVQVNSVVLKCRTAVDITIRRTSGGADYFTIPSGQSLTLDAATLDNSLGGYIYCYARAATGTPVLEAIGTF